MSCHKRADRGKGVTVAEDENARPYCMQGLLLSLHCSGKLVHAADSPVLLVL